MCAPTTDACTIRSGRRTSSRTSRRRCGRPRTARRSAGTSSGACSTTSSGRTATRSGSGSSTSTIRRSSACRRTASTGTATSSRAGAGRLGLRLSRPIEVKAAAVAVVVAALATAGSASSARPDRFVVRPLVSDRGDPQLVNAWGLAARAGGAWWVANEARSSSTVYAADGRKQTLRVSVPGGPTGVVFNGDRGFVVRGGGAAAPARFIYACEDGMIRGWSPMVPEGWSTEAEVAVDASGSAAVFRGLALASGRLYATDFHNDRVLVYDARWRRVMRRGAFVDPAIPTWYAPFGIAALGGHIFVTYAWRAPVNGNDGPTGGYVDEFDLAGPHRWHGATEVDIHGVLGAIAPT